MPKLLALRLLRALIPLLAAVLCLGGATAAAARRTPGPVPQGFVGVNADGPVYPDTDNHINLGQQLGVMASGGVQSVRVVFDWARAQPYASWNEVPPGQGSKFVDVAGVPTWFGATDQIVGLAAEHGVSVLPVVVNSPGWDADQLDGSYEANPRSVYWYAQYAQALVRRYGPQGSFWGHGMPSRPIRMWQIWNEPDLVKFWSVQPFAQTYVAMVQAARAAIKAADPGAQIVLGGLTNYSWEDLATIYRVPGARSTFDMVAIHPYTKLPQGVIDILRFVRGVMNRNGDRKKPIIADEISWPSAAGQTYNLFTWVTTRPQQAHNIATMLPLLARNRTRLRIAGFYYYTWAGQEYHNAGSFNFAGLFDFTGGQFQTKPAFAAFRRAALALEHCRSVSTAGHCQH